jgi:hypothetical protein
MTEENPFEITPTGKEEKKDFEETKKIVDEKVKLEDIIGESKGFLVPTDEVEENKVNITKPADINVELNILNTVSQKEKLQKELEEKQKEYKEIEDIVKLGDISLEDLAKIKDKMSEESYDSIMDVVWRINNVKSEGGDDLINYLKKLKQDLLNLENQLNN